MSGSRHCSARPAPAMPRFELRYRPAALADLEDIFRAVLRVRASPAVAPRYVERIRDAAGVSPSCHRAGERPWPALRSD